MTEEKKKEVVEAQLVEVPTQMGMAIQLEDGTKINEIELLIRVYNDIQKIKKSIA